MLEQLKQRHEQYRKEAQQVSREAGHYLWGWGDDPRNDACHTGFYEDVGQWVEAFLASKPNEAELYAAVQWLISAAAELGAEETYWYLYALHGHCREMIPQLSAEQRAELKAYYDVHYPRRDRMPVQQNIYKLLCK